MSKHKNTSNISDQPPQEPVPPEVQQPKTVAGGLPAIVSAVKSIGSEMGLVRGTRTLLKLNQPGGIDCPGCAWPEPDAERSHFEFCENGAKHIAGTATKKRVT